MSHALYPPSAAERWMRCPYSVKVSQLYPSISNAAADRGTVKHAIAALHLENGTESKEADIKVYLNAVRNSAVDGELYVEKKVTIVPDKCWGTSDSFVLNPNWLHLFDYKNGKSAVHAVDNYQLKIYTLGVVHDFGITDRDMPVTLTIVQPNASSGWPVKPWDTTIGHIMKFMPKVEEAIEKAEKPNPPAVAGSHCFWCPAKIHCQTYLLYHGGGKR